MYTLCTGAQPPLVLIKSLFSGVVLVVAVLLALDKNVFNVEATFIYLYDLLLFHLACSEEIGFQGGRISWRRGGQKGLKNRKNSGRGDGRGRTRLGRQSRQTSMPSDKGEEGELQLQLHYTLVLWMNSSMNNLWPRNKKFHFIFYNICQKHVHSFNSTTLSQKAYLI